MLKQITSDRKIRHFMTYDMEWIPGILQVRLVGRYDGNEYKAYSTVRAFLEDTLISSNRGKWFYAHAGGLADIQFVLEELVEHNKRSIYRYSVDASFSGSSAIIVHVKRGKNSWHFVDSYWLLRDKLKNIGQWIGYHKGDTGEPYDDTDEEGISDTEYDRRMAKKRNWFATVPWYELRDYNERDCILLWKAINEFENVLLELGGQLQMTIASSAMQLFRRRYLARDIDTNPEVNERARQSYFASRVEVIQQSIDGANYYDINSSFPHAMTYPVPGEYMGASNSLPASDGYLYLADVEIFIPDLFLPPTPIRLKGRVFFPHGKWRAWLTNVDIELLQREGGRILKSHEVLFFRPFHDLREYAQDIYERRKNAKTPFEKIALKYLLNSLYGKFAESPEKTKLLINPSKTPITLADQSSMRMTQLFPGAWLKELTVPIPHMHVPISTHITSIARRTLYDYMTLCKETHYCDTDGFSTTEVLDTGNELGNLKLEKKIIRGYFAASKFYELDALELGKDGNWKSKQFVKGKGFSRLTASRFHQLLEGEAIAFERMGRIRERYRLGFSSPVESTYLKRIKLVSVLSPSFDAHKHTVSKRFMYPDGTTRAWHLQELMDILG